MFFKRSRVERTEMVGAARLGEAVAVACVSLDAEGRPSLKQLRSAQAPTQVDLIQLLDRLWKSGMPPSVQVLDRGQYTLTATEVPDVPREEWVDALRWQLSDLVDYPVDDAVIQVLAVPESTQLRANKTAIVLVAPQEQALQMLLQAADEGHEWAATEVPEIAMRNVCALGEVDGKAHALMVFGEVYSILVITYQGELLMARTIEVGLSAVPEDESLRSAALGRAGLEVLRTLDTFERIHSQVQLCHVSVALPAGYEGAMEVLRDLVYQPLRELDLQAQLDLSALGDQAARVSANPGFTELCAIGSALRQWSERRQVSQVSMQLASAALLSPTWGLERALRLSGALAGATLGLSLALSLWASRESREADTLQQTLATLTGTVPSGAPRPRILVELEELRETEQRQKVVKNALVAMSGDSVGNYSGYLKALSRQAPGSLWITGLSVQPNGLDLELSGRMTDPRQLPVYLERLASEPLFRGRRFAQVEMKAGTPREGSGWGGFTEFRLKARASTPTGRTSGAANAPAAPAASEAPKP
jgi:hypothetical protein